MTTTSRREFLRTAAAGTALGTALTQAAPAAAQPGGSKRNIVFMLIDDMRFDSMGFMGHPYLETPNLDRMARGGVQFENTFVTTALCSPSRASILSGLYAHTHRVLNNSTLMPEHVPTFPRRLQEHGYETAFCGKWHMGGSKDDPRPGFDRWVSFRGQGVYENPTFNIDGEHVPREGYVTDLITDYAIEWLEQPRDNPFMLYVSHKAVHADFVPAARHRGRYANTTYPHPASMANTDDNYAGKPDWVRAQRNSWHGVDGMYNKRVDFDQFVKDYAETMLAVDDSVGRIMDALEAQGLLDSTLFVFTSDNGFLFGEHGLIDKRCMYEPSIRVPLLVHCPDLIEGGQKRPEMILNVDFAPTYLEAAGAAPLEDIHGRSFYGLLTGARTQWRDAFLYEYFWERSFAQTPTVLGVRTDQYKFMRFHGVWDRYEMYDIQADPDEQNNLLADYKIANEGGTLDNLIRRSAPEDLKALFNDLSQRLDGLLEETGCLAEPRW